MQFALDPHPKLLQKSIGMNSVSGVGEQRIVNFRVQPAGRPATRYIAMMFAWGPLLDDELGRISYSEQKAGAAAQADVRARFSFRAMSRIFSLRMPSETTLATTLQRSRGEVTPFELVFRDPRFGALYDFIYPRSSDVDITERSRLTSALRDGRWHDALKLAYGAGSDYVTTKTYQTLRNEFVQVCNGIGLFLHAPAGYQLAELPQEKQERINHGDYSDLHALTAEGGTSIGWVLAAYVALYRRAGSEKARTEFLARRLDALHELMWGVIPAWQTSHEFTKLYLPLLSGGKQGSAPRGRKAAGTKKDESAATPDSTAKTLPSTTEPQGAPVPTEAAPAGAKPATPARRTEPVEAKMGLGVKKEIL